MPDLTSMAASVGELLKSKQQTLAVSESAGGGLISDSSVAEYILSRTEGPPRNDRPGFARVTQSEIDSFERG